MPNTDPVAVSPLMATAVSSRHQTLTSATIPRVAVIDLSTMTKLLIRYRRELTAVPDAFDITLGQSTRTGKTLTAVPARGHLWIFTDDSATSALDEARQRLGAAERGARVFDMSHAKALLRLTGTAARELMYRLTAINLEDEFVPDGSALTTSVARVVTDVIRDDQAGERSYLLQCDRPYGRYLVESVLAAGEAWGAGFRSVQK